MRDQKFELEENRAGKQYRSNPDRYFHVMTEGWYMFTREGVRGPFFEKAQAKLYLQQLIQGNKDDITDPSTSWRL